MKHTVVLLLTLLFGCGESKALLTTPACPDGARWAPADLPIALFVRPEAQHLEEEVDAAVSFFARPHLFSSLGVAELVSAGSIVEVTEEGGIDEQHGWTTLTVDTTCRIHGAHIKLDRNFVSPRAHQRALTHELGHLIALTHDDYPHSLMYPIALDDTYELLNLDADLIDETYPR